MKQFNILLIILDTVRADHLSCYGYPRETTPFIDKIASEGVLYKNAISASCWTLESLASIFSGLLPNGHGAHWASQKLDDNVRLISEYFKDAGYKTFCLSNNDCFLNEDTGLTKGFDYFHNLKYVFYPTKNLNQFKDMVNNFYQKIFYTRYKFDLNISENNVLKKIYKKYCLGRFHMGAAETNYRLKRLINGCAKNNSFFFGTVLYIDAHLPYRPPKKFIEKFVGRNSYENRLNNINFDVKKYLAGRVEMTEEDFFFLSCLYDAEISYMDSKIGEIYNFLKNKGLLDSTMLIITSDHGENLGEHSLMEHRYCLYDTVLKVPLILRFPDIFKANTITNNIVQTMDILPTLLELFKFEETISKNNLDGVSIFDRISLKENYAYSEYLYPQPVSEEDEDYPMLRKYMASIKAIRDLSYKYVLYSDNRELLFNVHEDAGEENNIIESDEKRAINMKEKLIQKTGKFKKSHLDLHMQDNYKERLKALGYM